MRTFAWSIVLACIFNFRTLAQGPLFTVATTSIACSHAGSGTITASATGPFSYTWLPTTQTGSIATGLFPGTYTILIYNAGTSSSSSLTTTFNSLIPMTATVANSSTVSCFGAATGTAMFTSINDGSGNQSYLWTNGSVTYSNAAVNTLAAGTWTAVVTDLLTGCSVTKTFVITQPPTLSSSISASSASACLGNSITLGIATSGGTSPYLYSWINGPTSPNHTVAPTVAGSYIYTVTVTDNNFCSKTNTISLNFLPLPPIAVANISVCPLQIGTLTASGATSYTWSNNLTGNVLTTSVSATTIFSVTGAAGGCSAAATASIVLMPAPSVILSSNSPVCAPNPLQLTSGTTGVSYMWQGPSNFFSTLQNPIISSAFPIHTGNYSLTVTNSNGCIATSTVTVVVNQTAAPVLNGNQVACSTGTLALTSNSIAGATYLWSGPSNFTSALQNIYLLNPNVNLSGTYTLTVILNNCPATNTISVTVAATPSLSSALSSNSICAQNFNGSPATLTLSQSGASSYVIFAPSYINNSNPTGSVSALSLFPSNSFVGPVTLTLVGFNSICSATSTASFSIIPNPTVVLNSSLPNICPGHNYTFTSSGASSYSWTAANPTDILFESAGVAVVSPSATSTFSVIGTHQGCTSDITAVSVIVLPLPSTTLSATSLILCAGESATLSAAGAQNYAWFPGGSSQTSIVITLTANAIYTLQSQGLSGCIRESTIALKLGVCDGLEELKNADRRLLVFPNPNSGTFCLRSERSLRVCITNSAGQCVKDISFDGQTNTEVMISDLSEGIYFITSEENKRSQKIIVRKD